MKIGLFRIKETGVRSLQTTFPVFLVIVFPFEGMVVYVLRHEDMAWHKGG